MMRHGKLVRRRNQAGYFYVLPFLIGFTLFMLIPIVQSVIFSVSEIKLSSSGYTTTPVGWSNYVKAFAIDPEYRVILTGSLSQMAVDLPFVLVFSLFSAMLLNQQFRGRTLARVLFFLPVIVSTGVIATMESGNAVYAMMMNRSVAAASDGMKEQLSAMQFLLALLGGNLPGWMLGFLSQVIGRLYDIITASGLQILIFLSGLNTISSTLYEASMIEGANAWGNFWKITFPMLGPYMILNLVYSIIDSLTNMRNAVVSLIRNYVVSFTDFGYGLAISWIYFVIILALLALVLGTLGRKVFYHE